MTPIETLQAIRERLLEPLAAIAGLTSTPPTYLLFMAHPELPNGGFVMSNADDPLKIAERIPREVIKRPVLVRGEEVKVQ